MIIDVTGIKLTPGNNGKDCDGNGERTDKKGNTYECLCDECDYFLDCFPTYSKYMLKKDVDVN